MAEMGDLLDEGWEEAEKTGCTLPVWHRGFPLRVSFVPEYAKKFGLQQGDYLISVNGEAIPEDEDEQAEFISGFGAGSWVELEVFHAQKLDTIKLQCDDAQVFADLYSNIIASLKARDTQGCHSGLNKLYRQQGGSAPSTFLEVELLCTMAGNGAEYNDRTLSLMARAAIVGIGQAKYFSEDFDKVVAKSLRKILALEEFGEVDLANEVRTALDEAIEFRENDPPVPGDGGERRVPEPPADADGISI